jgi:uncharacterized protein
VPRGFSASSCIIEQVAAENANNSRKSAQIRRAIGRASHGFQQASRSFAFGAIITAGLGVLATIPMLGRVLFPRVAARFRRRLGEMVEPAGVTRLKLERQSSDPGPEGEALGFSVAEMTDIAERLLRDIGLVNSFAPLVAILGHGSHSLNNPHESAYDCGACGGAIGGPNSRAVAQIFNDSRVRAGLIRRGITIPEDTVFVGGLHNTCKEYVDFPDSDRVPSSHAKAYAQLLQALEETLDRNSHERARRFELAPLVISNRAARNHMDERAEDLAQVRPELGHATNAICVVGRRARTRGLFFDRRAFLNSYDPTQDDAEGTILGRILGAAIPVCGGINLEYYFSHVDSPGYGCGSKLPHNITGLLGVMDGAASDLRTGLPWQMVEIHEPVRLLFVVETKPEILRKVMSRNSTVDTMIRNNWVQMTVLDPESESIQVYENGKFVPYVRTVDLLPSVATSADWYRGWRDPLEFATIRGEASQHA